MNLRLVLVVSSRQYLGGAALGMIYIFDDPLAAGHSL
jgi:hypothetical protein